MKICSASLAIWEIHVKRHGETASECSITHPAEALNKVRMLTIPSADTEEPKLSHSSAQMTIRLFSKAELTLNTSLRKPLCGSYPREAEVGAPTQPAHTCLQQFQSQLPRAGNNTDNPQEVNGRICFRWSIHQWNTTQLYKGATTAGSGTLGNLGFRQTRSRGHVLAKRTWAFSRGDHVSGYRTSLSKLNSLL